jgi:selenocysteine lyase/cysteine desulfurase
LPPGADFASPAPGLVILPRLRRHRQVPWTPARCGRGGNHEGNMNDLASYRAEFPVTEKYVYFNHASVAPLPRRVAQAMQEHAAEVLHHGSVGFRSWAETIEALRDAAARLIGAGRDEIAITKNTSEGLAVIANGLDWRRGDAMVGIEDEFPANYFPWAQLERQGVQLRWLRLRGGRIALDEIDRACQGARLLAISFVQYVSGFRSDLDALGEICRRRGCLLVVDAVQGLGPFPVDVKRSGIHALSAAAHKWLLGPEGMALLYVDRELIPQVRPVEFGWTNTAGWRAYSREPALREGAARYECGTMNTIGCFGFRAALELFLEAGVGRITPWVEHLAASIAAGAREKGYELMTSREPGSGSGIVSFRKAGVDAVAAVQMLMQHNVSVSPRFGWIRASPHFYANDADVARFLELLP